MKKKSVKIKVGDRVRLAGAAGKVIAVSGDAVAIQTDQGAVLQGTIASVAKIAPE
jgi:preprotein translocase subunit YajC